MNQDIIAQSAINTKLEMHDKNVVNLRLQIMNEKYIRKAKELRILGEYFKCLQNFINETRIVQASKKRT